VTAPSTLAPERMPAAAIRVLLADDDAEARLTVCELLVAMGHEVVGDVGSGREAVAAARTFAPDVVLLDIHMPDGSGIDAATEIVRERPATAIVLFTGDHSLALDGSQVEETGAVALLPKPVKPHSLDSTLRMAVSRARALAKAEADADSARTALEHRKLIERAKGMLMRRMGVTEQEAYRVLQRTSQDKAKPMWEIAKAVIDSEPGASPGSQGGKRPG
jgi:two-component system, response regulator PdtaR